MSRSNILRSLAQPLASTARTAPARYLSSKTGPTHGTSAVDYKIFEGLPTFLPKENFDRLKEWQCGLWERLQAEVNNNPGLAEVKQKWDQKGLDITDLLDTTARDRNLGLAFNYASLLANNSFFLESLNGGDKVAPNSEIQDIVEKLEKKAIGYAEGIVGGGWLWIARTGDLASDLDIIPTFSSGTLLVAGRVAQGRQGGGPLYEQPLASSPTPTAPEAPALETAPETAAETDSAVPEIESAPTPPPSAYAPRRVELKTYPTPIAVLNLYELAWLGDKYGVWAKKQYVKDWFETLNWKKVDERNSKITI